jgi:hypothetical protein
MPSFAKCQKLLLTLPLHGAGALGLTAGLLGQFSL